MSNEQIKTPEDKAAEFAAIAKLTDDPRKREFYALLADVVRQKMNRRAK